MKLSKYNNDNYFETKLILMRQLFWKRRSIF